MGVSRTGFNEIPGGRSPNDGKPAVESTQPVLKKLSPPGKVHTFRHTFISVALTNGTPVATVQAWAGHLDAAIIKLYTHVADQVSQQQMEQLAAKLQPREDEAM